MTEKCFRAFRPRIYIKSPHREKHVFRKTAVSDPLKSSPEKASKRATSQIHNVSLVRMDMRPTTVSTKSTKKHLWEPPGRVAFSTSFLGTSRGSFWTPGGSFLDARRLILDAQSLIFDVQRHTFRRSDALSASMRLRLRICALKIENRAEFCAARRQSNLGAVILWMVMSWRN